MSRAQAIVVRGERILMVRHVEPNESYWCLPGGRIEPGESHDVAVVRELVEECGVRGTVVTHTAVTTFAPDDQHVSFLIDIGNQAPTLGHDPELADAQILVDVAWKTLAELQPLDRIYLWTAGLLTVPGFYAAALALCLKAP